MGTKTDYEVVCSNVTDMDAMFLGAMSFNQPLNNWNVSNLNEII